jgi:hypothetical protein
VTVLSWSPEVEPIQMAIAVAQTSVWLIVLPVTGALLGVVVGQFGPEYFRRRAIAEARYDAAITAVGKAFAARKGVGLRISEDMLRSPGPMAHAAAEHELSKAAVVRYLDANAEARTALALLHPWSPDLQKYWQQTFIRDHEFEEIVDLLTERRNSPSKRH